MQERDALTALSSGSQLWLLPPLAISPWSRRIDWYLGFQIRRAIPYRRFEFGPDMRQLMEAYEETVPKIPRTENAPLMVASASMLPNHQTVVVPHESFAEWVAGCHRVWKGLDEPSTRIFLPPGASRRQFEAAWPGGGPVDQLELVV